MKKNILIIALIIIILLLGFLVYYKYSGDNTNNNTTTSTLNEEENNNSNIYLSKRVNIDNNAEYNSNFNNISVSLKQDTSDNQYLIKNLIINNKDITSTINGTYIKSYEIYDKYVIIFTSDTSATELIFYNTVNKSNELILNMDNLNDYIISEYYTDNENIYITGKYCTSQCGNEDKENNYATFKIEYDGTKISNYNKINEYN